MRFVKAVSRKLSHQVKNLLNLFGRVAALDSAFDKPFALLCHFLRLFLSHGTSQQVGLAQGVASQAIRDLHYLFLIHDDAQSLLQNLLQLR